MEEEAPEEKEDDRDGKTNFREKSARGQKNRSLSFGTGGLVHCSHMGIMLVWKVFKKPLINCAF